MKKKICVITGSRADYGLLRPLLNRIKNDGCLELAIIATGSHLSRKYGLTVREIEKDGFSVAGKVPVGLSDDSKTGVCRAIGRGAAGFGTALSSLKPDMVVLLGDRFEILSAAIASHVLNVPVAHIHGGEITGGAMDDAFRHSITKMSLLHFTSTEEYRRRVIRLGESPGRVFNCGAPGIDNIRETCLLDRETLQKELKFVLREKNMLVTYHPETLEKAPPSSQAGELLKALESFPREGKIFTLPNADPGNSGISGLIDSYVRKHEDACVSFRNMGSVKYLSALRLVDAVVGNSSSAIIEAPYFGVPAVNIGDRQKGRLKAPSVISCRADSRSIVKALKTALSEKFSESSRRVINPYGAGGASGKMYSVIKKKINNIHDIKKSFYEEAAR